MKAYYENYSYDLTIWEETNFSFPMAHLHTKIELAFVLDGNILVGVNNEKRLLSKGEAVILGSGDIHYYDGRNYNSRMLILIFKSELIDAYARWPENKRFTEHFITEESLNFDQLKQLQNLAFQLKEENEKSDDASPLFIRSNLYKICGVLLRHIPTTDIDNTSGDKLFMRLNMLQNIYSYIEDNYMNNISVSSISKQFNISPKYFSKIFNSINYVNFKTHLNTIRVEKAEMMIAEGKYTLAHIAFECGFNSIRSFNRAFKLIRGETPSNIKNTII